MRAPNRGLIGMNAILAKGILIGLIALLWMPLIVTHNETIFPHVVGKAFFARSLIELLTAAWIILITIDPTYRPRRSWIILAFGAYVVASLLAAVFGVSFTKSFWSEYGRMMGVWDLFHWFAVVVIATSVLRTPKQWRILLNWLLVVALILSVVALAQTYQFPLPFFTSFVLHASVWITTTGELLEETPRVHATLGNPSFLAALLAVTTLLAVGFLLRSLMAPDPEEERDDEPPRQSGRRLKSQEQEHRLQAWQRRQRIVNHGLRLFWVSVIILGSWALFLTGTRGALVGLVAGLIVMPIAVAIWGNRRALPAFAGLTSGILLVIIGIFLVMEVAPSNIGPGLGEGNVFTRLANKSPRDLGTRLSQGKVGLEAFADRPIFGWGPENFSAAFNQLVDAEFFNNSIGDLDQVHVAVVEQFATKGLVGGVAFVVLWGTLIRGILRRRRPPREEIVAYTVLGALTAYFTQNLFLFDTPAMILVWAVLVAWIAGQESGPPPEIAPAQTSKPAARLSRAERRRTPSAGRGASIPWVAGGVTLLVLGLLSVSLTFMNQRPYAAAETALDAFATNDPWIVRFETYQKSFDQHPGLANRARQAFFEAVAPAWGDMSPVEQDRGRQIIDAELERGMEAESHNSILLHSAIVAYQQVLPPEEISLVAPLLERLRELAPQRPQTHLRFAVQELIEENPQGTLDIIDAYEEQVPGTFHLFRTVRGFANEDLAKLTEAAKEAEQES
jgi:hypothetical protein